VHLINRVLTANIYCRIVIPSVARDSPEVDYEAELAVVIGTECKNVSEKDAMGFVLGYTIANDVTARRWQGKKGGGQWIRSKCFDTFLPLGGSNVCMLGYFALSCTCVACRAILGAKG
jgi:2-keto-4-pentenoate hydratase/2-oxohepta-3-ene-1,7-dioic acid hydratase in catechol pathway